MMKIKAIFLSLLLVFNFSSISNSQNIPNSFADLAEKLMPSVVNISTTQTVVERSNPFPNFQFPPGSPFGDMFKEFGTPQERQSSALGSGFIIDEKGIIVTNNHVISDAEDIIVRVNGDKEFKAKVIGADPLSDIALLQLDSKEKFKPVKFGNSDKARIGDWVIAIGNPFGLGGTVTSGITNTNVMVNTEAAGYRAYTIGGFTDSSIGTYFPATGGGLEIFTGPLTASLTIGTITGGGGSGQNRGVYLTGNYDDSSVSQFADIGVVNLFFSVGELANYLRNRTLTVEKFTETTRHTGPSTLSASVVMYNAYTDSFGPTMSATIPASQGFYTSKDYTIGAGSFGLGEDANQWQMRITYTKDDSTAGGSVDYEWFGYSLSFSLS